jgi:LysR family glycine cleavage system transcriptional activator
MNLPPLQSITALETLDRLGSVKATAEMLNLTQSAVSHKLKTLQAHLGFPLTVTHGRGVLLTSQARQYVSNIRPALQSLHDAHHTVSTASGQLIISCAPGFAAYWLAPRLSDFRHVFPEIELHLRTHRDSTHDTTADLNIRFTSVVSGVEPLMQIHFFPVCSPAFAHANPMPKRPADLNPTNFCT